MAITFPLRLSKARKTSWPARKGHCGACGSKIKGAVVYLNAGSSADLAKSKIVDQDAFWHCGIHTSDTEMGGCVNVLVVEVKDFDQFNLNFCSVDCLEDFFASIIAEIKKREARSKKHKIKDEDFETITRKARKLIGKRSRPIRGKTKSR